MKKRILFVAMQNSPHTARWIELLADKGWDLHLFAINYLEPISQIKGVTVHRPWIKFSPRKILSDLITRMRGRKVQNENIKFSAIYPVPVLGRLERVLCGLFTTYVGESATPAPFFYGPVPLARLIKKLKPDLIHSMEFQHCGYRVLEAKRIVGDEFPDWLATNWGSDIYYYQNFDDHRKQIIRLLANAKYYSCECQRDVGLAENLGFTGTLMPLLTNTGGFDLESISKMRDLEIPSRRHLIMVKGYQHFAGRALTALDVLERCRMELKEYTIVVFSASDDVIRRVDELRRFVGLNIQLLGYCDHDTMLRMYARARVYIGISISDAISTSLLESMAMGAFPIQTNTSCCEEWIEDGVGGFSVPVDDVGKIVDRLKKALTDNDLVDNAHEVNWSVVKKRLDIKRLRDDAGAFYSKIFN